MKLEDRYQEPSDGPKRCPYTDKQLIDKILEFIQILSNRKFYRFQTIASYRIIESVLRRDGATITGLCARQCIDGDTVIWDRKGGACRIKDHPAAWRTGRKQTFRVQAETGEFVYATHNHPFFTKRGWVNVEDLQADDWLCVAEGWNPPVRLGVTYRANEFRNKWSSEDVVREFEWTEDHGRLLGYLTSDGYAAKAIDRGQSVKFTNINPLYLDEVEVICRKLFPDVEPRRYQKGNGWDIMFTAAKGKSFTKNDVRRWLIAMGMDDKFPTAVSRAPRQVRIAFLNRLYAGDGYVYTNKRGETATHTEIGLACGESEVYAQYCQNLLLRFGIHSHIKKEWMTESTCAFYRLMVTQAASVRKFLKVIGPIFGKEDACARVDVTSTPRTWRHKTKIEIERAPDGDDGERRVWTKIRSIKPSVKRDVYDITFPGKGWFCANGITVHNSGKTEIVSKTILGLAILLPALAKAFAADERLNLYTGGLHVMIFGPSLDKALLPFNRCRDLINSEHGQAVMQSEGINVGIVTDKNGMNGFSNGSTITARSASPNTNNEGFTAHLVVLEETQDMSRTKIIKEIVPIMTNTFGTMVSIGTANEVGATFKEMIETNLRIQDEGGPRNHFEFDYKVVVANRREQYDKENEEFRAGSGLPPDPGHLLYEKSIKKIIAEIGEDTPEFRMNYLLKWREFGAAAIDSKVWKRSGNTLKEMGQRVYSGAQVAGIDVGKTNDSTVVTIMDLDWEHPLVDPFAQGSDTDKAVIYRKAVTDLLFLKGKFETTDGVIGQYEYLMRFLESKNIALVVIDCTGLGDPVYERIKNLAGDRFEVEPFRFVQPHKNHLYKHYIQEIDAGRVTYPAGPLTKLMPSFLQFDKQHFELLKIVDTDKDTVSYEAPHGIHDDACDSGALACHAATLVKDAMMPYIEMLPMPRASTQRGRVQKSEGGRRKTSQDSPFYRGNSRR